MIVGLLHARKRQFADFCNQKQTPTKNIKKNACTSARVSYCPQLMKNEIIDMPAAEYHSAPGISKHGLDQIHRCPALYRYLKNNPPEPTAAMRWGTMVHLAVLEPERFSAEVAVAPEINRRTNAGKAEWEAFCLCNEGKHVVTGEEFAELVAIRDAVRSHPAAMRALGNGGAVEQSLFWDRDGIQCRARPDFLHPAGVIVDLKSTEDASPSGFARSVANFRYHVQAAFYADGLSAINGPSAARGFVFIAVEKKAPYLVGVYQADEAMMAAGRLAYEADLEFYRQCLATDTWPGYGDAVLPISLPKWAA